jgi:hypothetical protein
MPTLGRLSENWDLATVYTRGIPTSGSQLEIRPAALATLRRALFERIQLAESGGTAWTRIPGRRQNHCMPVDLTDLELETAAGACRAARCCPAARGAPGAAMAYELHCLLGELNDRPERIPNDGSNSWVSGGESLTSSRAFRRTHRATRG